jgi:hypothetical protein
MPECMTLAQPAVSLVGSDVCVNPSSAVLAIINVTAGSSDSAYTTTLFYTSPCGSVPPIGAYGQLVGGQQQALAALDSLSTLNSTIGSTILDGNATIAGLVGAIDFSVFQVVVQTNATVASVDCNAVYARYLEVQKDADVFVPPHASSHCGVSSFFNQCRC